MIVFTLCVLPFLILGIKVELPARLIGSGLGNFEGQEWRKASQALFHVDTYYGSGFLEIGDYNGPPLVLGWHVKSVEGCPGTPSRRDFEMGHYNAEVEAYSLFGIPRGAMEINCRGDRNWEPYP